MSNNDRPGNPDGRASWTPTPASAVGKKSTWLVGVTHTALAAMPGPAMISGTRVDSSYIVDFPQTPRAPRLSPWSLVYTTRVEPLRPQSARVVMIFPMFSSRRLHNPKYP